jgi:transglutaminase-like putative cysteine protease
MSGWSGGNGDATVGLRPAELPPPAPKVVAAARYDVRHSTVYAYTETVPVCHNEVHLVPRELPRQRLLASTLEIDPVPTGITTSTDYYGNQVGFFAIEEGHERLEVSATSSVEVQPAVPWDQLPVMPWERIRDELAATTDPAVLLAREFTLDSPLVRGQPHLAEWALGSFTPGRPWAEALVDLTRRIHREFVYDPTATTTSTPVEEVFAHRRGVCQDFAHLQIACLRSLGLPARYVSGYLSNERRVRGTAGDGANDAGMVGADASHAWLACWGGPAGWLDVDPTNDCQAGIQHVTVAWGRDYGDVSPIKGVCVGGGRHGMEVAVHVTRIA